MHFDFLIIGQGISGTWLSYFLDKNNCSFLVIDDNNQLAPSRLAAGVINPVTGRRHVTAWMIDELMQFSWIAYSEIGSKLGIDAISEKKIIDFFPTPQMRLSFSERAEESANYLSIDEKDYKWDRFFNYDFGFGVISPVFTAHLENLLPAWRNYLAGKNHLLEEKFDHIQLTLSSKKIHYKGITARHIIFCDGINSQFSGWFSPLPFAPNKGEVIIAEIENLPKEFIYKRGLVMVPYGKENSWWIGSNYSWSFKDEEPTKKFRDETETLLSRWLKVNYRIHQHFASVRPATIERRPFVGLHPGIKQIGILNGMGTKGCSLAPYFAKQLADHMLNGVPLNPEADIHRFSKMLLRQPK